VSGYIRTVHFRKRLSKDEPLSFGAPPNTRVKLAAPFFYGGHPFVNIRVSRRSLRAFR
jgi:hypothetical protein